MIANLDELLRKCRDRRCEKCGAGVMFRSAHMEPGPGWVVHLVCFRGHETAWAPAEQSLPLEEADEPIYVISARES
jgi:hypothetical protein